jgi:hypothetical protein
MDINEAIATYSVSRFPENWDKVEEKLKELTPKIMKGTPCEEIYHLDPSGTKDIYIKYRKLKWCLETNYRVGMNWILENKK